MYVIRRNEDGKYVSRPSSEHSYTRRLEDAQAFQSREIAEGNACENEHVMSISDMLNV